MNNHEKAVLEKMATKLYKLRVLNQELSDRQLRHAIDDLLTRAFLLTRDGNLDKLNGGKHHENRCK